MTLLGRAWSFGARLSRRRPGYNRAPLADWPDTHRAWIRENAPGHSFADIGGLFMKHGEYALLAAASGAEPVTIFDVGDPDLTNFHEDNKERGSPVRAVQGNLEDPESIREIGQHDIVWCTGVLYHTPNPCQQLMHLREITRELLYLGTFTIPEIPGFPQACVFYPYLSDADRQPYAAGYKWAVDGGKSAIGIGLPFDETPMRGYANCWWGMTNSALEAMLKTARFEVVERRPVSPFPYLTELIARPVPGDAVMPPLTYFRERGHLREKTGERLPFADYYELQRQAAD
jgi:hypothetical protein